MMSNVSSGRQRQRRFHTPQFKAMVVQSCFAPGVSMSSKARQFDLNATLLRRWVSDYERGLSHLSISDRQSLIACRANLAQQDIQSESVGIAHGTESDGGTIRNTDFLPIRLQPRHLLSHFDENHLPTFDGNWHVLIVNWLILIASKRRLLPILLRSRFTRCAGTSTLTDPPAKIIVADRSR